MTRRLWLLLAAGIAGVVMLAEAWPAAAQLPPVTLVPPAPSTTQPPPATTPPPAAPGNAAQPSNGPAAPGSSGRAPQADGESSGTGRQVPASAQSLINSIKRTPPNNSAALVAAAQGLVAAGMDPVQAAKVGYGHFPLAGEAHWIDDWLFPRWTGVRFRFHEGCDLLAAYGTPVRAPMDGIAVVKQDSLGGLTVHDVLPDGTFFYMAHLSGIAPGLVSGQRVQTGDIVGFVGTSGNAAGGPPHLHFGIYEQGHQAIPPKPYLDRWVAEAMANIASITPSPGAALPAHPTLLATALVRDLAEVTAPGPASPVDAALQWASTPPAGGESAAGPPSIDWASAAAAARAYLGPLTVPSLAAALEGRAERATV